MSSLGPRAATIHFGAWERRGFARIRLLFLALEEKQPMDVQV
ncbi:hypothetical protein BRCON_1724 [Candidatus Sumerlaea chitinivorans]|uniref:Uncharacterized protein n=1 Tax=Sumerlaea chitinivorans TaxID=2250252 RepID=A0A2Z4Y5J8_SUMC1|nr:hypothetical protein BRCON_1724 [Candidatus Sumerlaea chitinivorans]